MDRIEEEWIYEGDSEDINGEVMLDQLKCDALAQAERAAAARPGVSGRLEEVIERIIANNRVQSTSNSVE